MSFQLNEQEKQILLELARTTITNILTGNDSPFPGVTDTLEEKCGAFVTLHKKGKLRGCIGHMTGVKPLYETIREVAKSSALYDPRFPKVTADELEDIDIEITVLTPLQEISDPSIIEIGKHGIYMEQGRHSGVLLPQVAVEQEWDKKTFLEHTCRKAGLSGDCWKNQSTKISIFEGIIFGEK